MFVQDIDECIRAAAEAAADAALPTCPLCDGEGCAACHLDAHGFVDAHNTGHHCICIGTGAEPLALAHLLIGIEDSWAAEALSLLVEQHLESDPEETTNTDNENQSTEGNLFVSCEPCRNGQPCAVLDVYLSVEDITYSEPHIAYQDGECDRCFATDFFHLGDRAQI
jgi:hypothetical protein